MSISHQLRRLNSILGELAAIDFGYPLGENTVPPPVIGSDSALQEASLAGIRGLTDLYSACDGIRMPDVHNGYFVYDLERIHSQYPDSDPQYLLHADGSETSVLSIGQDGGGNHFVLDRDRGNILFLPIGQLHEGRYDGRKTRIRIVAEDISHFIERLIDDATAFVMDVHEHKYLTDQ